MPTRDKRFLPTLLDMLDARSKTILEAWHTDVEGAKFGEKEQDEIGTYNSSRPFERFAKRPTSQDPNAGQVSNLDDTWPTVSSVSLGDPFTNNSAPRSIIELWFKSDNTVLSGPLSNQVQRGVVKDRLSTLFGANSLSTEDYSIRFFSALNGAFANVPSDTDVQEQGALGYNVGQIRPFDSGGTYIFGDRRETDFPANDDIQALFTIIANYEQDLMQIRPGANRVNIVFNIRTNLNQLLQQNILLPSDIDRSGGFNPNQDLATAIEEGEVSNISNDTFDQLYLNNQSVLHAEDQEYYNRSPAGTIGGRAVADLEGPRYTNTGAGLQPDDNTKVFSFEEDKERAHTYSQQRGFIDNTPGFTFGTEGGAVGGLLPSVQNDFDTGATRDRTTYLKSQGRAEGQFFPFMFETVNKGGRARNGHEFKQFCYLQATLQSLSESYAPSWTSKHFFGRTEQIHTYTMTDRTIDLSFVIFANEIRRLQNLYERITWLAQQTYASYDDSDRLKSGPLIRMSIGDMFSNLTGFIRSLSFDWSYLGPGGKWEITQGLRIPMACSVQMNFTVIHDNMPDRNYALYPGPLLHPKGLVSNRGNVEGESPAPLIPSADRPSNMSEVGVAGYTDTREEQYMDYLNRNKSVGTVAVNSAGETDAIF